MDQVKARNVEQDVPTEKKLDELYELIDDMKVCLMTTARPDGHLVTRPMEVRERASGADLWFVTNVESEKLDELAHNPHVNLGFYNDKSREWVSVSGTAKLTQDRELVRELYTPDLKAWFPEESETRDGGPDDPRIALVLVEAHTVIFSKQNRPRPVVLFEIARAMVTGSAPKVSDIRTIDERELPGAEHHG